MAVPNSEAVQWLPSGSTSAESRSGRIGPIILEAKQTGERSAGNPHAALCVQRRLACSAGVSPAGVEVRAP